MLQFCGSKKSLASGLPMADILFPAQLVGAMILPLMLCAFLARRYGAQAERDQR